MPFSPASRTASAISAMPALAASESTALPLSKARSDSSVATVGLLLLITTCGVLLGVGFGEVELGFLVGLALPLFCPADWPPLPGLASAWAALSSRPSHQLPAAIAATRAITTGTATSARRRGFSSSSSTGTYGGGVQPGSTAMGTGSGSSSGSTSGSGSGRTRASGTGAAWAYSVSCWGPLPIW